MMNRTLDLIRDLVAGKEGAKETAERFLRTVTPRWDEENERLVATHPDDGNEYECELEDVNGSIRVYAQMGSDGKIHLEIGEDHDFSETCLVGILTDCPLSDCMFFVSDEFEHEWGHWANWLLTQEPIGA